MLATVLPTVELAVLSLDFDTGMITAETGTKIGEVYIHIRIPYWWTSELWPPEIYLAQLAPNRLVDPRVWRRNRR